MDGFSGVFLERGWDPNAGFESLSAVIDPRLLWQEPVW